MVKKRDQEKKLDEKRKEVDNIQSQLSLKQKEKEDVDKVCKSFEEQVKSVKIQVDKLSGDKKKT